MFGTIKVKMFGVHRQFRTFRFRHTLLLLSRLTGPYVTSLPSDETSSPLTFLPATAPVPCGDVRRKDSAGRLETESLCHLSTVRGHRQDQVPTSNLYGLETRDPLFTGPAV